MTSHRQLVADRVVFLLDGKGVHEIRGEQVDIESIAEFLTHLDC